MLQQFSWGQFLIAAVLLSFLWYVVVALVCYRSELRALLGLATGKGNAGADASSGKVAPGGWAAASDNAIEREVDAALMGRSRLPEGVEVKSSAQVSFSAVEDNGKDEQPGLIADVIAELKTVFAQLEEQAGDKKYFFRLLAAVKEEYGPLSGHPSLSVLNRFIVERAPFHLSADELDNLWY